MFLVWAFKGEHAGRFVPLASQAEVDAAVRAGWAQDARITAGHELRLVEPEPPTKALVAAAPLPYLTRDLSAEPNKTPRSKEPRRGRH